MTIYKAGGAASDSVMIFDIPPCDIITTSKVVCLKETIDDTNISSFGTGTLLPAAAFESEQVNITVEEGTCDVMDNKLSCYVFKSTQELLEYLEVLHAVRAKVNFLQYIVNSRMKLSAACEFYTDVDVNHNNAKAVKSFRNRFNLSGQTKRQ